MKILELPQGRAIAYSIERTVGWTDLWMRAHVVEGYLLTICVVNTTVRDVGSAAHDHSAYRIRQRGSKSRDQSGTSGERGSRDPNEEGG